MSNVRKFFNSDYYIAIIFIINVICWVLRMQLVMMGLSALMAIVIILLNINRTKMVTLFLANIINYRSIMLKDNVIIMVIFAAILAPVIFYDLFHKKLNFRNPILIALLIFLGSNLLSLLNTNKDNFYLGIIGICQVLFYIIVFTYYYNKKEKEEFSFMAKNACVMGVAIAVQLLIHFLKFYLLSQGAIDKGNINLGWGISNFIAMTVTVLVPLTFYLYIENQKRKHIILIVIVELGVIFLTFSKGAFLALGIIFIPFIIMAYRYAPNKKVILVDGFFCLVLAIAGLLVISQIDTIWNGFIAYFKDMDKRGWFNDQTRMTLYKVGIEQFKLHPLFGAGSYTCQYYLDHNINYHNYIVQTLATLGLVGLATFAYLLYTMIKKTLVDHYFNIALLFIIILMAIHGLVDTTLYNPLIMLMIFIYLPFLKEKEKV